jgi:hypothetical protein
MLGMPWLEAPVSLKKVRLERRFIESIPLWLIISLWSKGWGINMPNSIVVELIRKVAILETKVQELMKYQKWQMGLLTAILAAVFGAWVTR